MADVSRHASLRGISLNLLKVLAEVGKVRSVSLAGENLGLSQSAVSHALSQLRVLFDDELFLRTRSGMSPTPLAADIGERLPKALGDLESAITAKSFEPGLATGNVRIACSDYTMSLFLPGLLGIMESEAPRLRLIVVPLGDRLIERLDVGKLDLVIAGVREVPERLAFEPLFGEYYVWVHRKRHPLAGRALAEIAPSDLRIVSIDYGFGTHYDHFESLAAHDGFTQWTRTNPAISAGSEKALPTAHVTVPNFFTAASLIAESDLVAQLPARLAAALAPRFDLAVRDDWPAYPGGELTQIWHRSFGNRPAQLWLRNAVTRASDPFRH